MNRARESAVRVPRGIAVTALPAPTLAVARSTTAVATRWRPASRMRHLRAPTRCAVAQLASRAMESVQMVVSDQPMCPLSLLAPAIPVFRVPAFLEQTCRPTLASVFQDTQVEVLLDPTIHYRDFRYNFSFALGATCNVPIDPCVPNPCRNNGLCVVSNGAATCDCRPTFTGSRCETPRQVCGGVSRNAVGHLEFPIGGNVYQHGLSCAWLLITNSSLVLNVTFTRFNLERSTDCKYDFLQVRGQIRERGVL